MTPTCFPVRGDIEWRAFVRFGGHVFQSPTHARHEEPGWAPARIGSWLASNRALALDPNLAAAHAVRARILSESGRHEEAGEEIEVALRLDPDSYEVNKSAAIVVVEHDMQFIRSIAAHIGDDFRRVRIGIGHPGDKARVTGHVLGNYAKTETDDLSDMLAADAGTGGEVGNGACHAQRTVCAATRPA